MNKQQATFDDFFSECYLKYKEYIKNYIAIRICHPHEAEDLAQDVFVRLWEHRAFVNKDTVWSLLFTIARNIVTDKIRRYYKQEDFVAYVYNRMEDTSRNTTEDTIHFRELKKMHDQVMETLPVKRRQIYELSFNHELSCPAIAGKLSLSPRTVECQLLLARKTVRTYLKMNSPKSVKYQIRKTHINFNNLIVLWKLNPNSYVQKESHWLSPCCWVVRPVYCSMQMIL